MDSLEKEQKSRGVAKRIKDVKKETGLTDKEVKILKTWRNQTIAQFQQINNKLDLAQAEFVKINNKLTIANQKYKALEVRVKALEDA